MTPVDWCTCPSCEAERQMLSKQYVDILGCIYTATHIYSSPHDGAPIVLWTNEPQGAHGSAPLPVWNKEVEAWRERYQKALRQYERDMLPPQRR